MEPEALRCDVLDDDRVAQFKEVLEMRVRVLVWQTMELVCLHHRDEASTELEVPIPNVDSGPNGHVRNSGGGVITEGLGHDWSSGWCGGDWFDCQRSSRSKKLYETVSSLGVPLDFRCSFLVVCSWSYTILFSSTTGENKQSYPA